MLAPARPAELNPALPLALRVALSAGSHVLVVGPGGWEFEEGCLDRHTLADGLCNEQQGNAVLQRRPWVLADYARRWALVITAINAHFACEAHFTVILDRGIATLPSLASASQLPAHTFTSPPCSQLSLSARLHSWRYARRRHAISSRSMSCAAVVVADASRPQRRRCARVALRRRRRCASLS